MKKSFVFISLLLVSSVAFAGSALPFEASLQTIAESFQSVIFWVAIIAFIAWALYAMFGNGDGIQRLTMIVLFAAIGLNIVAFFGTVFGTSAAAGLLF